MASADEEVEVPDAAAESAWDTDEKVEELRAAASEKLAEDGGRLHAVFAETQTCRRFLRARKAHATGLVRCVRAHGALCRVQRERAGRLVGTVRGYDRLGRPAILVRPRLHFGNDTYTQGSEPMVYGDETDPHRATMMHSIVLSLDELVARCERPPAFATQFVAIFDMADFARANMDLDYARAEISHAANNYPERLGAVYIINCGWLFWIAYKLVSPFIDARTRGKIKFVDGDVKVKLQEFFAPDQLPSYLGGTLPDDMDVGTIFTPDHRDSVFLTIKEGPLPPTQAAAWRASSSSASHAASAADPHGHAHGSHGHAHGHKGHHHHK